MGKPWASTRRLIPTRKFNRITIQDDHYAFSLALRYKCDASVSNQLSGLTPDCMLESKIINCMPRSAIDPRPRCHFSTAVANQSGGVLNPRPPAFDESSHLCAFHNAVICGPTDSKLKPGGCSVTNNHACGGSVPSLTIPFHPFGASQGDNGNAATRY